MKNFSSPDFKSLFTRPLTWIDLRSPVEFSGGAIPGAINLPLLSDNERHEIGICYKENGQERAIERGHVLVSGEVREKRLSLWEEAVRSRDEVLIYCFRGGLRSQTVQNWLHEVNLNVPLVEGGYKALRQFLMSSLEDKVAQLSFEIVSGPTGSGKTKALYSQQKPFVDLEDLAKHRGSAFGSLLEPQPPQATFENSLALALLKFQADEGPVLLEDESRMIGKLCLPKTLFEKMKRSPRRPMVVSLEERVSNIFDDYILDSPLGRSQNLEQFDSFEKSVHAISKRLGGVRSREVLNDMESAKKEFVSKGDLEINRVWIRKLLVWYYDPLYKRSLKTT